MLELRVIGLQYLFNKKGESRRRRGCCRRELSGLMGLRMYFFCPALSNRSLAEGDVVICLGHNEEFPELMERIATSI